MKQIPLNTKTFKGHYTLVDDEDYEWLSQWRWSTTSNGYVRRAGLKCEGSFWRRHIRMHRQIMGVMSVKTHVDHINHNPLDNRRCNLRVCTAAQNQANEKLSVNSVSGYKGVCWHRVAGKWRATIHVNKKSIHLGLFVNKTDAVCAYNKAAKKHFGVFALLNEVKE